MSRTVRATTLNPLIMKGDRGSLFSFRTPVAFAVAFASLAIPFSFSLNSRAQENSSDPLGVFTDLAGIVAKDIHGELSANNFSADEETDTDTDVTEDPKDADVPFDLAEIVRDYYAEATVPASTANGVLDYLTSAYSEHGYYDKGSWTPKRGTVRYVPFTGTLPEYEAKDFRMPVDGHLTSSYGYRSKFRRFHRGIDISLNLGDTVACALPGVVTATGYETGGYGRYVVVSHAGGVETLYAHLIHSIVKPGQEIEAGDPIGLGGITGNATGPHLHFETRYRGVAIDPIPWFNLTSLVR